MNDKNVFAQVIGVIVFSIGMAMIAVYSEPVIVLALGLAFIGFGIMNSSDE